MLLPGTLSANFERVSIMFCYANILVCYSAFLFKVTWLKSFLYQSFSRIDATLLFVVPKWSVYVMHSLVLVCVTEIHFWCLLKKNQAHFLSNYQFYMKRTQQFGCCCCCCCRFGFVCLFSLFVLFLACFVLSQAIDRSLRYLQPNFYDVTWKDS